MVAAFFVPLWQILMWAPQYPEGLEMDIWYNNITGPPPPSVKVAGISSLIYFSLVVAWAYWMNRLRPVKV